MIRSCDLLVFDAPVFDAPVFDVPVFDVPVFDVPVFDVPDGCAHGGSDPEHDAKKRMNNRHAWKHAAKRAAMLPGCGAALPPGKKASEALLNYLKGG